MKLYSVRSHVFLQVPVLRHDPEGPAGANGVDPGHIVGWKDLHLCLQC